MRIFASIKIWAETLQLLRIVSAITNEKMAALIDRLARAEYERVKDRIPQ